MIFFTVFILLFGNVCCWEDSIFQTRAKIENLKNNSNFGAELDYFSEGDVINLFIGAPNEKTVNDHETGKIHVAVIDRTCDNVDYCKTYDLKFGGNSDGNEHTLAENILSGINEKNIQLTNKFLGSKFKIFEDTLWFCDNRLAAAATCSETNPEKDDTRCHTLSPDEANWHETNKDASRHDFNIGSCYFIENLSTKLDDLFNNKLAGTDIKWVSPCFAYTDSRPHKIKGLLFNNGKREDARFGYEFDIGYFNMNCQFGSSIFAHPGVNQGAIYIGAPGQHHQGNVFRFDSEDIKIMGRTKALAGLSQIKNHINGNKMTFSIPDYQADSTKTDSGYTKTENAGQRYGSNINAIEVDGETYILDASLNDVNKEHKRTGCIRVLKLLPDSSDWDTVGSISSLQPRTTLLASNNEKFCGEFSHESFGYSIVVTDINGDGFDDIIVGSPRYSEKRKYDIGRIYIYLQQDGQIDDRNPIKIAGTDIDGQFGFSIENVGDRNGDGINDIVVSAPYASHETQSTGKIYLVTGGNFEATSITHRRNAVTPFCLNGQQDVGSIEPFAPIDQLEVFNALGTKLKFAKETDELFATAGESDRVYVITLKETYKFDIYFKENKSKLNNKDNSISVELCILMKSRPQEGQKTVKVEATVAYDNRLVNSDDEAKSFKLKELNKPECIQINRKIDIFTQDCDWGAFVIKVVDVDLKLKESHKKIYGQDFGCRNQLPKTEIQLADNQEKPMLNININTDTDSTLVNGRSEDISGQIVVAVTKEFIKRPTLMMEYDSREVTFDPKIGSDNDGWVLNKPCPNDDDNCGTNYLNRKCIYKTQGFDLSEKDDPFVNDFTLNVHATGAKEQIELKTRVLSCGKCIKLDGCSSHDAISGQQNHCDTKFDVSTELLLDPVQTYLSISPKQVSCASDHKDENEVDNDSSISINVKSKIIGKTPIRKGEVWIEIVVPESQIFEDPCERNTNRIIGRTFDIQQPICKRDKNNVLTIKVTSNQEIDLVNFSSSQKYLDLQVYMKKKPVPQCYKNQTIVTSTFTVNHDLYSEPQIVTSNPETIEITLAINTGQMSLIVIISIAVAFIILITIMIVCMVRNRAKHPSADEMATQKADISFASAGAQQGDITMS